MNETGIVQAEPAADVKRFLLRYILPFRIDLVPETDNERGFHAVCGRLSRETLERITTEYGTQLRMNRSIQAEGSFAVLKEDMGFRQYLYRGKRNVLAQSVLAAIAHNINKLHFKIQGGRTGQFLTDLKAS